MSFRRSVGNEDSSHSDDDSSTSSDSSDSSISVDPHKPMTGIPPWLNGALPDSSQVIGAFSQAKRDCNPAKGGEHEASYMEGDVLGFSI